MKVLLLFLTFLFDAAKVSGAFSPEFLLTVPVPHGHSRASVARMTRPLTFYGSHRLCKYKFGAFLDITLRVFPRLKGLSNPQALRTTSPPRSSAARTTPSPWTGGRSASSSTRCWPGAPPSTWSGPTRTQTPTRRTTSSKVSQTSPESDFGGCVAKNGEIVFQSSWRRRFASRVRLA